ncbi:CoA transferase [Pradoshia sp. D12]|uniref:CaiB/BaiF CoA transferase family protein n=1 Tax=Bacillaceae TaxID=186817 RepID=UPI00080AEA5F|nr:MULTISPECIES: CaiB/BaiF CoA-transferase family protein [Bacillaceae]OCA86646.1 alpha-methylacyl-CoA racemase [Bacillus sp. FJAT-27986]QFK71578.1 CoA transferase [Pradoshia sp. D12]TPF73373.1 CoA transferase [Bacillus sp. D12]
MLKGIKVVDFTQNLPGPYATLRLADLGAEVIKIEPPTGDHARMPLEDDQKENYLFRCMNRNKNSLALDLKNEADKELAIELIRNSDILIESYRPGVMARLGLGYEDIKVLHPSLIYCSLSGYGQKGTMHQLGSHDLNYMALSGVLAQLKDGNGRPIQPSLTFADLIGGTSATEAILGALFQRERSGSGSYLDIALLDTTAALMNYHVFIESATGRKNGIPTLNGNVICYGIYETKDHRYMTLCALETKFWRNFCAATRQDVWINAQFSKPTKQNEVYQEIVQLFASKTFEEWIHFSMEVDCCMAPVLEADELSEHIYMKDRNLIHEKDSYRYMVTGFQSGAFSNEIIGTYPKLGQHNRTYQK